MVLPSDGQTWVPVTVALAAYLELQVSPAQATFCSNAFKECKIVQNCKYGNKHSHKSSAVNLQLNQFILIQKQQSSFQSLKTIEYYT